MDCDRLQTGNDFPCTLLKPLPIGRLEVFLRNETLWLIQNAIAELFDVTKSTISEHLKNIYDSSELERVLTVRKFRTVQSYKEVLITETPLEIIHIYDVYYMYANGVYL